MATISHRTKTNEQLQILSAITYCELAVHLFFFEKTSVLRLHCGNPFAPIQSLYAAVLWAKPVSSHAAGNFCKVTSGRALNRPRSPEVRKPLACFLVLFARRKKNVKTSPLQEASRFFKPRFSPPQPQLRTATIKIFQGSFEVLQTSNQPTKQPPRTIQFNPFAAAGGCFFRLTAVSLSGIFPSFWKTQKEGQKKLPFREVFHLHPLHRQFKQSIVVHKSPQEQPTQSASVCAEEFHEP